MAHSLHFALRQQRLPRQPSLLHDLANSHNLDFPGYSPTAVRTVSDIGTVVGLHRVPKVWGMIRY